MRILVTGAGGFVGRHLIPHLNAAGHDVIRTWRSPSPSPSPDEWRIPADLRLCEDAPGFPADIDAVVHLAAANPAKGDSGAANEDLLRQSNVEGTAALARRCAREGVKRFVFLSSANVHAARQDGRAISETDPIMPQNLYARSKIDAEVALRDELSETSTRLCILRSAPVFGAGGRGTVATLSRLAASPLPLPLRGLGGRRSLIAVDDLVEAIRLSAELTGAEDETLLVAGGAATPAEIVTALREGAGRAARILPAPKALIGTLGAVLGKAHMMAALTKDFVIDAGRAERVLGWSPEKDLATRLRERGAAFSG